MRNLFLFLLITTTCLNAQTKMSSQEASALRALVKKQANITKTISSDFIQYKHLDFLDNDITSKGKLAFKSPNTVKWEYTAPFKYTVLFKEETLFINNEGEKSNVDIGSSKVFKQLNTLITSSIKGDMFADDIFDISYYKKDANSEVHFMPTDKQFSEFMKRFEIIFNSKGDVLEVKMVEPTDDYTRIIFSNRIVNKNIPDAVFAH